MNAPTTDPSKRPPQAVAGAGQEVSAPGDQDIDEVPMFKRKRVIIPLFLTLVGAIVAVALWYTNRFSSIATDDAFVDCDRATISAKIGGRIARLAFDENDTVHSGDTLVRLDDADQRAQLQKAEAALRFQSRSAELAEAKLTNAQADFSRVEKQFKGQIVSQEAFDHAQNTLKQAAANQDMAQAQITTAQADCAIAKTQLLNTVVVAPLSGVIAKRWVIAGDVVSPGQAIFSMFDNNHAWITANFEETKLRSIKPGLPVSITVDAFPGQEIRGKVLSIGRSTAAQFSLIPPGNASGNFTKITQRVPVKIALDGRETVGKLLPGLSVYVKIFTK